MITVRNPAALDFETTQLIHVQIEAQDMGTLRLSTQTLVYMIVFLKFSISISDSNGFSSFLPFCWDDYDGTTRG